jgi:tetratricopeptide (TPR) repeat protein
MNLKLTYFLLFFATFSFGQNDSLRIVETNYKLDQLEEQLQQVKTNQLNYKIEKDLLKETYSNNYSRIQTIITIVLGLLTVLGFLGINSITKTKKEYENELKEFKDLKAQLEKDYDKLKEKQESFDKQIIEINSLNQEQDKRLKVLDVKEKANGFISRGNYLQALEYITIGLELEPKDNTLRHLKALAYFRMSEYEEAIKINQSVLEDDPKNSSSLLDLAELLLITKRDDEFVTLRESYKTELVLNYDNPKSVYLEALHLYNANKPKEIKKITTKLIESLEENERKRFTNWEFEDIRRTFKDVSEERTKCLNYLINFLNGSWNKLSYQKQLEKDKK